MKVFFRGPIRSAELRDGYYKKICEAITSLGYTLIDSYMMEHTQEDHYESLEKGGNKTYEDFYNDHIEGLKKADINVLDCSIPSLGTGYLVNKSLEFNKPTVLLYKEGHIPHLLVGIDDDKVITRKISDNKITEALKAALDEAKTASDKRFNFFISPTLLTYIERASKQQGITKSTFIRSLILEHMRKSSKKEE